MIRFQLFGIPVSISPFLWVVLALLGGGMTLRSTEQLLPIAIFVIAAFISLLAHELGHALVGRRLGGGHPQIHFAYLGGLCHNPDGRWTRLSGIAMTAAGPVAALLWGALAMLILIYYVGDTGIGIRYALFNVWGGELMTEDWAVLVMLNQAVLEFLICTIQVSFWWSVLNLLPVYPLDGGQILGGLMNSARRLHLFSVGAALLLMALFFWMDAWYMGMLMIYFAVFNYKVIQTSSY